MKSIADISDQLRASLKRSGRTQEAVREAAGLSRQTAVNVFKGTEDFKLSTLLAVADKLGLEVALVPKGTSRAVEGSDAPVVETKVERALFTAAHQLGQVKLREMIGTKSTNRTDAQPRTGSPKVKP